MSLRDQIINDLLNENEDSEYYHVFSQLFLDRDYEARVFVPPDDPAYKIRRFYKIKDEDLETIINDLLEDGDINLFKEIYEEYLLHPE